MLILFLAALGAVALLALALLLLAHAVSTLDPEARERARSQRGDSTIDDILARDARDRAAEQALFERGHLGSIRHGSTTIRS